MKENCKNIIYKLKNSSLFKDSFWVVFGNGFGNIILLFTGILIARFLGKDVYGEYGFIKTTMFQVAAFSTFGLGYTSTKFIAEDLRKNAESIRSISVAAIKITLFTSTTMSLLLFIFAAPLSKFVNTPQLETSFRFLALIIIFRALYMTTTGLLGGFKKYKVLGINTIINAIILFLMSVLLTYLYGLNGSLFALLFSQFLLFLFNIIALVKIKRFAFIVPEIRNTKFTKKLLKFSFPVAMQELTYSLSCWVTTLLITKYATIGDLAMYSVCMQWNAIIIFIPSILTNVVLSYLSTSLADKTNHKSMITKMVLINFFSSLVPLIIVFVFSSSIVSFYGATFYGMERLLNIFTLSSIFISVSSVFQTNLISSGRNWILFITRSTRDLICVLWILLFIKDRQDSILGYFAIFSLIINIIYLLVMYIIYRIDKYTNN